MSEALENEILSPKMERAFGIGDPLKKIKMFIPRKASYETLFLHEVYFPAFAEPNQYKTLKVYFSNL